MDKFEIVCQVVPVRNIEVIGPTSERRSNLVGALLNITGRDFAHSWMRTWEPLFSGVHDMSDFQVGKS